MAQKVEARGSKGGNQWDDGADHDNVAKVYVRGGLEGIQYVKFVYVKSGKTTDGLVHGASGKGFTQMFEIDHLGNEYLVSVTGCYDNTSGVIQSLQFETNLKSSEVMGYDEKGTKFTLEFNRVKIVGFHGSAGKNLTSLGAYFRSDPIKLPYQNGSGGQIWDDGVYAGVRKVYVTHNPNAIKHIKVDYDQDGKVVTREHGERKGTQSEFALDYPDEYITSVEGSYDPNPGKNIINVVRSLIFKTSKGRTSPTYGGVNKHKFVLESKGLALVGFHGRAGLSIDALGAYFGMPPIPPPPPTEKLQGKGGDGGASWDDGVFEGVRKIYIGQGENGVAAVKFEYYDKNNQMVVGEDRGKKTMLGYEEFELDYPSEYITVVEGCYDNIFGSDRGVITMLKFKTNKRTSPPFGLESTSTFVLGKEGYKVVGFHGKASHELHQLGVTVGPITK